MEGRHEIDMQLRGKTAPRWSRSASATMTERTHKGTKPPHCEARAPIPCMTNNKPLPFGSGTWRQSPTGRSRLGTHCPKTMGLYTRKPIIRAGAASQKPINASMRIELAANASTMGIRAPSVRERAQQARM